MAHEMNMALTGEIKLKFMEDKEEWLYAKIIKKVYECVPYSNEYEFNAAFKSVFDDKNRLASFVKEIKDREDRMKM